MCIFISISLFYILLGRPFLSGVLAIGDLLEVFLGSSHGIVPGGLWLVVWHGRPAAGVTGVVVINVAAVGPTIV